MIPLAICNAIPISLLAAGCALAQMPTPNAGNPPSEATQVANSRRIDVQVTTVSGDSVYLNQGRAAGLRSRDKVILSLADGSQQAFFIDSTSRNSSRCLTAALSPLITAGTSGVAFPSESVAAPDSPPDSATTGLSKASERIAPNEHPQWQYPIERWSTDQPLLAPAQALPPNERPTQIHGQFFSQYLHTWNWKFVDNQYSFGRIGTDLWIENPFGDGGRIRFRGDLDARGTDLFDGGNTVDTVGRISLFSYAWGGGQAQPTRVEIGRFLPFEFPEFGFLDGLEWVYRAGDQHRFGFSAGALPEPFPAFASGEDLQAALFYSFRLDEADSCSVGAGYQKTWHNGNPDRDLIVVKADYNPTDAFHAHGTIWADLYGQSDTLKAHSWEITEAIFNQSYQFSPIAGMGTYYTRISWPQLLRREIDPIFAAQILRNRRSSYGAYVWRDLTPQMRLNGRIDRWQNQDSLGGTTWEAELNFRQLWGGPVDASMAFLVTDGLYVSGPGARFGLTRYFTNGLANVTYTVGDYRLTDDAERLMNQAVTTSLDFYFPSGHSFSLFGDYRFGQAQDAASLGLTWRKRF